MNIIELLLRARGARQVKRETELVRKGVASLTKAAAAFGITIGGAAVVGQMVRFSKQAIVVAANAQAMQVAFTNMSGGVEKAEANLEAMRTATRGLAHDTDLMNSAQMLLNKSYTDTPEKLERTVYAARRLGAAFRGLSAPQALEWWALMMSGQARMRLNEFGIDAGIVTKRIQEMQKANKDLSRTDAWNIVVMEEAEKLLESLGEEVIPEVTRAQADLAVATKDLQLAWGEFVTSPVIIDGLEWITDRVDWITSRLEGWSDMGAAQTAAEAFFNAEDFEEANRALEDFNGSMDLFQKALIGLTDSEEEYNNMLNRFSHGHMATRNALELEVGEWLALKDPMRDYVDMMMRVASAQAAFRAVAPRAGPPEIPKAVQDLYLELQTDLGKIEAERVAEMAKLEQEYQEEIADETAGWNKRKEDRLKAFHAREREIEANYYDARHDLAAGYNLAVQRAEEDHQKAMRRLRERYDIQQEDAIANRDAIAYLRNRRNYEIERREAEEDHQIEMRRRSEDYALQIQQMEQALQEQQEARLAAYQEAQAEEDAAHAERLVQLEKAKEEELAALETAAKMEKALRKQEAKDKIHEYIKENEAWSDATQAWFDNEERIRNASYAAMLVGLQGFFDSMVGMVPTGLPPLTEFGTEGPSTGGNPPPWPGTYIGERAEYGGASWYWTGQMWLRAYSAEEAAGGSSSTTTTRTATEFTQTNNIPAVDGQTAEDIVALIQEETTTLLEKYTRGY